jgi:hypothetical protein
VVVVVVAVVLGVVVSAGASGSVSAVLGGSVRSVAARFGAADVSGPASAVVELAGAIGRRGEAGNDVDADATRTVRRSGS